MASAGAEEAGMKITEQHKLGMKFLLVLTKPSFHKASKPPSLFFFLLKIGCIV